MILITGGAGYIGSVLTNTLLAAGYKVKIIDSLIHENGYSIFPFLNNANFEFTNKDVRDIEKKDITGVSTIVHLAGIVGEKACNINKDSYSINYAATARLFKIANCKNVERFIFSSTCSVYGAQENSILTENSNVNPLSSYAKSKADAEAFLLDQNSFCSPIVLRFATAYGVSPRMRFDLTVNDFTKEVALNRELSIFQKDTWRPYCHVLDIARAIKLVIGSQTEKTAFQIFNVGSTEENYTKGMIADELRKEFPIAKIIFDHEDYEHFITKPQARNYRVSFQKIKDLGFKNKMDVSRGIQQIKKIIQDELITDPDDKKYYN